MSPYASETYNRWHDAVELALQILERDGIRHLLGKAYNQSELELIAGSISRKVIVTTDWKTIESGPTVSRAE